MSNNQCTIDNAQLTKKSQISNVKCQMLNGFTLIELMVVVGIIAILSIIGMAIYTDNLKKSRDATRRGDIDAISNAWEAHYKIGTDKPYLVPQNDWFNAGVVPADPQGSTEGYFWNGANSDGTPKGIPTADLSTYTVCAKLDKGNGNSSTSGDGAAFTNATGEGANFYCRRNIQ